MGRMGAIAVDQAGMMQIRMCARCDCVIACACDPTPDDLDGLWLSDYSVDEIDTDADLNRCDNISGYLSDVE